MPTLAIVTATTDPYRAAACIKSWRTHAVTAPQILIVENGGATGAPYLGVVPAFRRGVDALLHTDADVIACFHDDLEISERGWDVRVLDLFNRRPTCGLAGFGGATGLGSADLYQVPYAPEQLARLGFRSNLLDAEHHGVRGLVSAQVVCLDGFSQIGRRAFWLGQGLSPNLANARDPTVYGGLRQWPAPWTYLESLGVIHHFYDGMLGCLAKRYGWDTWYLPIACQHYGGRTAVGDAGYQRWADDTTHSTGGDHAFWETAHKIGYEAFRDVLPLRA